MSLDFDKIRTPADHLDVLVEPAFERLTDMVEANRDQSRRYDFRLMDVSYRDARAMARRALSVDDDVPIVAAGHQPEFIHPGVWAKHAVLQRLARVVGAMPLNLVVDQDTPKHARIDIPSDFDGRPAVTASSYGSINTNQPFEHQPPAVRAHVKAFASDVERALGAGFDDTLMPRFLERYAAGVDAADWVEQAVAARKHAEARLGVTIEDRRVSRLCGGPLLGQLLVDARRFADAYNRSIDEYRRRYRVRTLNQPVPKLVCDGALCETPLWVYRPRGPRRRLFVRSGGDRIELLVDDETIVEFAVEGAGRWEQLANQLASWCAADSWRIRPRALTLTLWARLLMCDLFIHGIGGAQYDRVTDLIIENYFGVTPPRMACVSATLHPPIADRGFDLALPARARRELRDIRYNPQRYVSDELSELVERRAVAVAESRRLRNDQPRDRIARRKAFLRIREANHAIHKAAPHLILDAESRIESLDQRAVDHRIATRRDYFFCLYPTLELERLLERLPNVQKCGG